MRLKAAMASSGRGHAHVHVQREGGLPPGQLAHRALLEHLVAGACGHRVPPADARTGGCRRPPRAARACRSWASSAARSPDSSAAAAGARSRGHRRPARAADVRLRASRARPAPASSAGSTRRSRGRATSPPGSSSMISSSTPSVQSAAGYRPPVAHVGQRVRRLMPRPVARWACSAPAAHEALEQRQLLGALDEALRVPLDAQAEVARRRTRWPPPRRRATMPRRRTPRPSPSIAWWWKEFTSTSVRPISFAEAAAGASAPRRGSTAGRPRLAMLHAAAVPSGRCWRRVPPRATFSTCMPRQIARIGTLRRVRLAGPAPARTRRARARSGPARGAGAAP